MIIIIIIWLLLASSLTRSCHNIYFKIVIWSIWRQSHHHLRHHYPYICNFSWSCFQPDVISLTSRDQRWVGAWWLGPVACGFLLLLDGFILLGFPRKLPGSDAIRKEAIEKGYIKKDKIAIKGFKSFLPHLKALLTNGTFMFQNLAFCFEWVLKEIVVSHIP